LGIEDLSDFVRLVAINTRRQHVGLFLPQLAFDHFAMNFFNLCMALRARFRNVLARNR